MKNSDPNYIESKVIDIKEGPVFCKVTIVPRR